MMPLTVRNQWDLSAQALPPSGLTGNPQWTALSGRTISILYKEGPVQSFLERHGAGFDDNKCPVRRGATPPPRARCSRTRSCAPWWPESDMSAPACPPGPTVPAGAKSLDSGPPRFIRDFAHCPNRAETRPSAELRVEGSPSWEAWGARQSHAQRQQVAWCSNASPAPGRVREGVRVCAYKSVSVLRV